MREGENLTLTLSVADLFMETSIVVELQDEPGEGSMSDVCVYHKLLTVVPQETGL